MFGVLYGAQNSALDVLEAIARDFSPRIEVCGARVSRVAPIAGVGMAGVRTLGVAQAREIVLDLSGLERLLGTPRTIADELRRSAADRGQQVRVAMAATRTAARLVVRDRAGVTVIEPGTESQRVAPLPLEFLAAIQASPALSSKAARGGGKGGGRAGGRAPAAGAGLQVGPGDTDSDAGDPDEIIGTLRRWGLRTCGAFAALEAGDVAARLGQTGVAWQRLARGEDPRPLLPALVEERFEQTLELEWPIDGFEPLSFVLGRVMEPLEAHLERRDRGAAVLHVRLRLVTKEVHERSLELPTPIRDARTLRTLALLDLESHPPAAAIDQVTVAVDPTPGRIVQFSLLTRPLPSPEQLSTLMARLTALMGEGRCGAPQTVDTWEPGAWAMTPFRPVERRETKPETRASASTAPADPMTLALRRFRLPLPVRVRTEDGKPLHVTTDRRGMGGGPAHTSAGPWRTSGAWWTDSPAAWDRDEWDVTLTDGTYRLFRERATDAWFIDAEVD